MSDQRLYTFHYSQPDDYHFCQDSVLFPKFVAGQIKNFTIDDHFRTLDVCAGCGVIGFELAFHDPRLKKMDFLEIQSAFEPHFLRNREITGHSDDFRYLEANYAVLNELRFKNSYDLIVANPPYFMANEGRLSPSNLQNRCRFFLDSGLDVLLKGIAHALKSTGVAYLLIKSGHTHGRNTLRDASLALAGRGSVAEVGDIRGTSVFQIRPV